MLPNGISTQRNFKRTQAIIFRLRNTEVYRRVGGCLSLGKLCFPKLMVFNVRRLLRFLFLVINFFYVADKTSQRLILHCGLKDNYRVLYVALLF